ncbi:hypothetical protein [Mesorhizobium sp. AR10]|nr:hypothetical protein [Mesorhizobium sp. AR10]
MLLEGGVITGRRAVNAIRDLFAQQLVGTDIWIPLLGASASS